MGFSQEGSQILPIADMGIVKQLDGEEDKLEELGEAKVIAVMQLEMYRACLQCKVVSSHSGLLLEGAPDPSAR